MANTKISALTLYTTPLAADVIPIVDVANLTTKKITFSGLESSLTLNNLTGTLNVNKGGTGAATLTGILKGNGTSAFTAVTAPAGVIVGDTDSQTLTNKTLTTPTIASFVNANHAHVSNATGGVLTETSLGLSDITTNNSSSSQHGFAPKSPADATKFLNGAATPAYAAVKESDIAFTNITTNDVTLSQHGFVPRAPNDTTKFLRGDGTWAVVTVAPFKTSYNTVFETSGRFSQITATGGTITFGTGGVRHTTTTTTGSRTRMELPLGGTFTDAKLWYGSPSLFGALEVGTAGNLSQVIFWIGNANLSGSSIDFTQNHIGFKLIGNGSSQFDVYGTQASGAAETATSILTTIAANTYIELFCKVNASSSVDYYWRTGSGDWSSATTISSTIPTVTTAMGNITFSAYTAGSALADVQFTSANYSR
jgi:hypothetical protein